MELFAIILLVVLVILESSLLFYEKKNSLKERTQFLDHIKDLTDKLYFVRTQDFVSNKILTETPKEEETKKEKEEEAIPLENVPVEELRQ